MMPTSSLVGEASLQAAEILLKAVAKQDWRWVLLLALGLLVGQTQFLLELGGSGLLWIQQKDCPAFLHMVQLQT